MYNIYMSYIYIYNDAWQLKAKEDIITLSIPYNFLLADKSRKN
jgi:hypothetical protein